MKESQSCGKIPQGVVLKITDVQLKEVLEVEFCAMGKEVPPGLMPRYVDSVLRKARGVSRNNNLYWNHREADTDYSGVIRSRTESCSEGGGGGGDDS